MVFLSKNNMILFRYYDNERKMDRAWYNSSNIVYSECDDNENDYKTLRIVFKKGDMYEYYKVDVKDYLMFMAGGVDGSNGKSFFKFIKPKYEFKKLEPVDLAELAAEMERLREEKKKSQENTEKESQ
jgi:hypothetical protein